MFSSTPVPLGLRHKDLSRPAKICSGTEAFFSSSWRTLKGMHCIFHLLKVHIFSVHNDHVTLPASSRPLAVPCTPPHTHSHTHTHPCEHLFYLLFNKKKEVKSVLENNFELFYSKDAVSSGGKKTTTTKKTVMGSTCTTEPHLAAPMT